MPSSGAVLQGFAVAPGLALGPARHLRAVAAQVPDGPSQDPAADWAALRGALAATGEDIRRARDAVAARAGAYDAAIFDAHLLFLDDEALLGPARAAIIEQGSNAARGWLDSVSAAAAAWEALDDPYLRARAADLRGVGEQVLRHLLEASRAPDGQDVCPGAADRTDIALAPDLTPAEIAGLARSSCAGVACAFGSPASHSAILARALGIPAVMGAGETLLGIPDGTRVMLDGEAGTVTVEPPPTVVRAVEKRRAARELEVAEAGQRAHLPAVTRDGRVVPVVANLAAAGDVEAALSAGADGVGLLRTEFLFLSADQLPGEDEQERMYRTVAAGLDGRPLVVRTLDVGADKQLPCLPLAPETNPCLGLRGIRLGLSRPELLEPQLRALLRVGADYPVQILLPMVTTVDEVRRARRVLEQARESLTAATAATDAAATAGATATTGAAAANATPAPAQPQRARRLRPAQQPRPAQPPHPARGAWSWASWSRCRPPPC